jgi:hypothetical protein
MIVVAAQTVENGGDIGDVIKRVGTAYVMGQIGAGVGEIAGTAAGEAAAAAEYGTSIGSAQTAALAAQEAGIGGFSGTIGNIASNAASGATRALLTGGDPEDAILSSLVSGGISAGIQGVTGQIEGFNSLPPAVQNAAKSAIAAQIQGRDPTKALVGAALNAGVSAIRNYQPSMEYNFDPATNPADPNADSDPDLNGSTLAPEPVSLAPEPEPLGQTEYPVQDLGITDANMESYQAAQQEAVTNGGITSQWVPNADGTYTMTYDDGSSVVADAAGNILSSTDATDTTYTGIPAGTSSSGGAPTAAPTVQGAPTAAPTAAQGADFLGFDSLFGANSGENQATYSGATRMANIGQQYDVGGTDIFNNPDGVKSGYAAGGSIDELMAYLRNSK